MKKILALIAICAISSSYSFAYAQMTPADIIENMSDNIDSTLMEFLSGIGSQTQQIVDDNIALYLGEYCVANNVLASVDIVDCGDYQSIAHVLDGILENLVPDFESTMDISSIDIASIDEAQIIVEETQFQVEQEMVKLDRLTQIMNKALDKPNLTDKQKFGIHYVLFAIATIHDIFGLLPSFLEDMTWYIVDLRNTFGDINL